MVTPAQRKATLKWQHANRDKINKRRRELYAANPETQRQAQRAWRAAHPGWDKQQNDKRDKAKLNRQQAALRVADPARYRRYTWHALLRKYGLTPEDFGALIIAQSGLCAICGAQLILPNIDHCHVEGHVRGVLCQPCNTGLGYFHDDPAILARAIAYLAASGPRAALHPIGE